MKTVRTAAALIASLALLASPLSAYAQVYYYAPGTVSGAYNYNSYIPAAAMPYVNMGYQMQQQSQQQYQSYSYPSSYSYSYPTQSQSQYQYQSQSQYQTSYPTYNYYTRPSSSYSYNTGEVPNPNSVSYPSGTYGPFGTQLCYWSDYPVYAPCGHDPQQWIQDPYTGEWY
jgi:hypothetical protein